MPTRIPNLLAAVILPATAAMGGDLNKDAAIGGTLGGLVGAELGGREGAIVGSGIGAAVTTGVTTREHDGHDGHRYRERHRHHSHPSRFCPPGQAKRAAADPRRTP